MKELEKKKEFKEAVLDPKTKKRKVFFKLGPRNNWKNILDLKSSLVENPVVPSLFSVICDSKSFLFKLVIFSTLSNNLFITPSKPSPSTFIAFLK